MTGETICLTCSPVDCIQSPPMKFSSVRTVVATGLLLPSAASRLNRLVPEAEDRGLALVAEDADRGRVEREQSSCGGLELQPASREDAQDVPVREEQGVAVGGT